MNAFSLIQPETLEEALQLLQTDDPLVRPLAGGTALMLLMKAKLYTPQRLVSLHRLSGLQEIQVDASGDLHIGTLVTLRQLELSPLLTQHCPVLRQALRTLSNVRVRNVATLGGHLAHGDPHMDLPPVLMALNARVCLQSVQGQREMFLQDFLTGYYSTALRPGELITEVIIPALPEGMGGSYYKFTAWSADDWPMCGVAAFVRREGDTIRDVRLAVSAATERPVRLTEVEAGLNGQRCDRQVLQEAAELAKQRVKTLADLRGSAGYKREMVSVCVRRALEQAVSGARVQGGLA
ncbi:MAG: xanthine dehydrogenase family protein subunit M [Alicyclobacillus sp.]|nr:xanthine dehydrogenase family protein subunit M [Alicyclobacillus sp.]